MEKTLVLIKPDAVKRGLVGEIINLYEKKGLQIEKMKWFEPDKDRLAAHYRVHEGKAFYDSLMAFMLSGPLVAMVLKGDNAISVVRKINGATDYLEAECGSIRGLYAYSKTENCVHGSDGVDSATCEIDVWFGE